MIRDISLCITNFGHSEKSLKRCIESIHIQRVPEYEIMVCSIEGRDDGIKYFHKEDWAKRGEINKLRNYLCDQTTKEFIALMDNGIELASDWYSNIKQADCFDLIGSRLVSPEGKRVVDWAYQSRMASQNLQLPLRYDEWSTRAYISGILMVLRRSAWEQVRFNEDLLLGQNDDVDFCLHVSEIGFRVGVFPKAVAMYHHDQNVYKVRKYPTFDEPLRTYPKRLNMSIPWSEALYKRLFGDRGVLIIIKKTLKKLLIALIKS